jgi:hypothetical protein
VRVQEVVAERHQHHVVREQGSGWSRFFNSFYTFFFSPVALRHRNLDPAPFLCILYILRSKTYVKRIKMFDLVTIFLKPLNTQEGFDLTTKSSYLVGGRRRRHHYTTPPGRSK